MAEVPFSKQATTLNYSSYSEMSILNSQKEETKNLSDCATASQTKRDKQPTDRDIFNSKELQGIVTSIFI